MSDSIDQRAMDQRTGRTLAEIEAERKARIVRHYAHVYNSPIYWLNVGALIALGWVIDTDERLRPLDKRLADVEPTS
jgi:hypothetical protein